MHDTGKIGIPEAILGKPEPLDTDEWRVMKRHCQIRYDILLRIDAPIFKLVAEIALYHHEKWDGSGYPQALTETAMPESVRIVAVADVLHLDHAPILQGSLAAGSGTLSDRCAVAGQHFDPQVANCFMDIQRKIVGIGSDWPQREEQNREFKLATEDTDE